jgi:hypothetical protein
MPYEDDNPTALSVESHLISGGWSAYPNLEKLRRPLMEHILTGTNGPVAARAVLVTAHRDEPGALFVNYYDDTVLDVTFSTKRRLIDVDTLMQPHYGSIRPALDELRLARIDPIIASMWLQHFRTDNALYRVIVVAGMCLTGALLEDGFRVTV